MGGETPDATPDETSDAAPDEVTIKLRKPLQLTKETEIDELVLKPSGRAFRDFEIEMNEDGSFIFKPYSCAIVGLKMAGYTASAAKLVDQLHPKDQVAVGAAVFRFFG